MTAIDEDDLARGPSQCHGKHARRTNGARTNDANLHDYPARQKRNSARHAIGFPACKMAVVIRSTRQTRTSIGQAHVSDRGRLGSNALERQMLAISR
jgi:hypothetical protein